MKPWKSLLMSFRIEMIYLDCREFKATEILQNKLELEILLSVKENTNIFRFLKENSSYLDDLFWFPV